MAQVSLGVIGCGVIGNRHLEAAAESPLINIAAIADLREEAARSAADKYGVDTVYKDGADLLKDPDVEAVILAMPACVRTDLALKAFEQEKHVLTEKPVAMNAEEVRQLIAARGDLVAACCSSRFRFMEAAEKAGAVIESGALGRIRVVRCRGIAAIGRPPSSPPPVWRLIKSLNAGGIMSNWGCYDLDYVLGLLGWRLKPKLVLGNIWTVQPHLWPYVAPGSDAETHVAALIYCEGGTVVTFERGEYVAARGEHAWEIVGTEGSLRMTYMATQQPQVIHDEFVEGEGVVPRVIWDGIMDWSVMHRGPVVDFAEAILEKREPSTTLEKALVVQEITDAIYASAEKGEAVAIQ